MYFDRVWEAARLMEGVAVEVAADQRQVGVLWPPPLSLWRREAVVAGNCLDGGGMPHISTPPLQGEWEERWRLEDSSHRRPDPRRLDGVLIALQL